MRYFITLTAILAVTAAHVRTHKKHDETNRIVQEVDAIYYIEDLKHFILNSEQTRSFARKVLPYIFNFPLSGKWLKTASCLGALFFSRFDLSATSLFEDWFSDDSKLTLSQVGSYFGATDIAEYVDFVHSDYFNTFRQNDKPKFFFGGMKWNSDKCDLTMIAKKQVDLNTNYYDAGCLEISAGSGFTFDITGDDTFITIKDMSLFFPNGYISDFAGRIYPESLASFVCNSLQYYCDEEWQSNAFSSQESCKKDFLELDISEGDALWVDGNTRGCRMVHATYAISNSNHCPHISLAPIEDHKGKIKCQTSAGMKVTDEFTDAQLSFFKDSATGDFGFDETMRSYKSGSCQY